MTVSEMLQRLAECYGITDGYVSETGEWVTTPPATKAEILKAMGVAAGSEEQIEASLKTAPAPVPEDDIQTLSKSAFWPLWLVEQRVWGFSTQLYSLRSLRNWGIGDFADLAVLAERTAKLGADFIGISPLHALFTADPSRISPYAPSSRNFLNPMYIAPDLLPGFDTIPSRAELLAELPQLRASTLIDYPAVYRVKLKALTELFAHFTRHADDHARQAFANFRLQQGESLANFALYEALSEYFVAKGGYVSWSSWPEDFRNLKSQAVRDFARAQQKRIEFHTWLQWIADNQLAAAQARARRAGMRIGLYLDLAIGVSPDGSSAWCGGHATAREARIGAPPDVICPNGQNWGLIPFSPLGLSQQRFDPFRSLLRANMRHAGALRLDHAMGLKRLHWIAEGSDATEGAYVRYPFRQMLEMVADESWVARCLVIGEDLGTLPPGFSDIIVRAGLLSYQVLYFSRWEEQFQPPYAYRREALVCASTHDLPTLKGWWKGNDILWRFRVGASTYKEATAQTQKRSHERRALLQALNEAGLIEGDLDARAEECELAPDIVIAIHRFLAWTPCRMLSVQLEDALGAEEQPNLPGTVAEHPNWRRKIPLAIESLGEQPLFRELAAAVAAERPR